MDVARLTRELDGAKRRVEAAIEAVRHRGDDAALELQSAVDARLHAERALAAARDEEHAVPFELGVRWDVGAPHPHLLTAATRTFLAFYLDETAAEWDGRSVRVVDPRDAVPASLALVEFVGCTAVKMGPPNDEVLHGHPLYGKGLASYEALTVTNSRWVAELVEMNRAHEQFAPSNWEDARHFLFPFHDETVEAVARDVRVETSHEAMQDLLHRALTQVWD